MTTQPPAEPKIYHIVHVDRLPSIVADGGLYCDADVIRRSAPGTTIGMNSIKLRRLNELTLATYPNLHVGECVPFYFCPRSIMLYLIHQGNHAELAYRGGQCPVVHLEADMRRTVAWADANGNRWVFTLSNAGAYYFEERHDLARLGDIDWSAVQTRSWQHCKESKQAEFLLESRFPWALVSRIGVFSRQARDQVDVALKAATHRPCVEIKRDWYY